MANVHKGVAPASADGAPAPDQLGKAVAEAFTEALSGVAEAWKQIIAANPGLAYLAEPVAAEILPADRKAVYSEPGIDTDWDEDTDAMVVHGVGWNLSWGCKLSIARDHDTGEHYVCVNTSGEDQRKGIVSRSTTREQIASFGQQLLNVFGEPDPRDAEIKRLRAELDTTRDRLAECYPEIERLRARLREVKSERDRWTSKAWAIEADRKSIEVERDEAREEWKRADAEVTSLTKAARANEQRTFEAYAELLNPIREVFGKQPVDASHYRELRDGITRLISNHSVEATRHGQAKADLERANAQAIKATNERNDLRAERDRLRKELDLIGERHATGLAALRTDFTAAVDGLLPKSAGPRRWSLAGIEPPAGATVRRANDDQSLTWTKRLDGTWHANGCGRQPEACDSTGSTWSHVLATCNGELVEVPAGEADKDGA